MRNLQIGGFIFVLISLLSFPACRTNQNESEWLINEAKEIERNFNALNQKVDSLWDFVSLQLQRSIDPDFPPVDKEIFIHSRNADHIRMFMSFDLLSPELQELVHEAGRKDKILAEEIRTVMKRKLDFEDKKNAFLQELYASDMCQYTLLVEQIKIMQNTVVQ